MRLISLIAVILISTGCFASDDELLFRSFTIQDGIPSNRINHIIQDTTGFIWIALESGLLKFDGKDCQNYYFSPVDSFSISSNLLRSMFVSSKGNLWIATIYGLCRYDPEFDRFIRYIPIPELNAGDKRNIVASVGESSDGTIFFITGEGYLYYIKDNKLQVRLILRGEDCRLMVIDSLDRCWISAENKIFLFDLNTNLTTRFDITYPSNVKDPEMTDLLVNDSSLFITSYNYDLIEYNFITGKQKDYDLVEDLSHTTCISKHGISFYVGTSEGLRVFDNNTASVASYSHEEADPNSLLSKIVRDVYLDKKGNLWIATEKGLNVAYKNIGFQKVSCEKSKTVKDNNVRALLKDENEWLWLGYTLGFEILDKNNEPLEFRFDNNEYFPTEDIGEVFCVFQDSDKNIWIGTYTNGIYKYESRDNKVIQYYPGNEGYDIAGTDVRDIKEDAWGNIWTVIHGKGIYVLGKGEKEFQVLTDFYQDIPDILNRAWTFVVDFDNDNNLWIGSSCGAFFYDFSTKTYKSFNNSAQSLHFLSSNNINSVYIDSKNNIWLGSNNGVNILSSDFEEFRILNKESGLPSNKVQSINEDQTGIIWISSSQGISKVEPLLDFNFSITNFDMNHGLNTNEFELHATFLADDNKMYFGGSKGFTCFFPKEITIDRTPPKLVLKNFYVFDKKVAVQPNVVLQDQNTYYLDKQIGFVKQIDIEEKFEMIGFEFVALDFLDTDKNQYQYFLEGVDDNWRNVGSRNVLYFNNLRPGNYIFKVKGSNSFGVWNEKPLKVGIKIVPPIWKSRFALIVYISLILLVSFFLIMLSIQKAEMRIEIIQGKKLNELRTRFFMNVSHELKTPLTLISIPLKKIKKQYEEEKVESSLKEINMVSRNVDRLIRIMNQLFDFRRIELNKVDRRVSKQGISQFAWSILDFFTYDLDQRGITLNTDFPENDIVFYFDSDKMDKIIFNLLSNSIKNLPENGVLDFEIRKTEVKKSKNNQAIQMLRMVFLDNGPGIPKAKIPFLFNRYSYSDACMSKLDGTGIGLSIVQEFVELHYGDISIESKAKKDGFKDTWTRVTLEFPINDSLYKESEIIQADGDKSIEDKVSNLPIVNMDYGFAHHLPDYELITCKNAFTVLVIDDNIDICNLLMTELSSHYKIYQAFNGEEGLQKAERYQPDIILSDILMPGMDGYQLCKVLKTNIITSHIPVMLLTGKSTDEDELKGYTTGADAFISKPFDLDNLLTRVDALITNRIQLKKAFLSSYGIELKKVVPTNTDERFIQNFIKIINENIANNDLNVEKITKELGMSRSMLYKKLNSLTNTSVNLFIRKIRLQKATELLANDKMNISEVAYAVGFDNLPYFSKCFQEEFGVSPSKYYSKKTNPVGR